MKHILVIMLLVACGCGISPLHVKETSYISSLKHGNVLIRDEDVKTSNGFKEEIAKYLTLCPLATKELRIVHLVKQASDEEGSPVLGKYQSGEIWLTTHNYYVDEIVPVLLHELGHAVWHHCLNNNQRSTWITLYNHKKMERDLTRWGRPYGKRGLPSTYAAKNVKEFFAEHYRVYYTDSVLSEVRFWQARDLLIFHRIVPRD